LFAAARSAFDEVHDLAGAVAAQVRVLEADSVARTAEVSTPGASPAGRSATFVMAVAAQNTMVAVGLVSAPLRLTALGKVGTQHWTRDLHLGGRKTSDG